MSFCNLVSHPTPGLQPRSILETPGRSFHDCVQASLEAYRLLGLNAKVGGKLVPARTRHARLREHRPSGYF